MIRVLQCLVFAVGALASQAYAGATAIRVDSPMPPPAWALLQRELLDAESAACRQFYQKYFDERGFLLCVERWGGDDGPDDAIENVSHWPLLYALGADESVLKLYRRAWEGHLRQYSAAKTTEVPFARDGMYYKEFPVQMDWLHNGEGLTPFIQQGVAEPKNRDFQRRLRRFSRFYTGDDPTAPNYDSQQRILRSMFTGSRGPLLRKATAVDWAGDPIEVQGRFKPRHGEESYQQMLEHFQDYNDIVGDHPQNLGATTLAALAYMLDHEENYKRWVLDYVDAWLARMEQNGGIIPSNIGLSGEIGGEANGKWYGGVYGWGFTVAVPGTDRFDDRNTVGWGLIGFVNAYMLSGDDKYLRAWANMIEVINSQAKVVNGQQQYPTMYGDQGWYGWRPTPWNQGAMEIYYLTQDADDRKRLGADGWLAFLEGGAPDFPEQSLRGDFAALRSRIEEMRNDATTPDTRLSDDPMAFNPALVGNLCRQMWGALPPNNRAELLLAQLRYFDLQRQRPGLPPDVAALVTDVARDQTKVTLVNISPLVAKRLVVQGGAYGEHRCLSVQVGSTMHQVDANNFVVHLAPGCGAELTIQMSRHSIPPRLGAPWDVED